ncbi:MAG: hypothetical protein LUF01_09935 [Bacteroides sp.]|nr:hypothetical protein [Bacteroides sp.]
MKKTFVFLAFIALTSISYAAVQIAQVIVTDCGTSHKIPSDATAAEACAYLDYWTARDCR